MDVFSVKKVVLGGTAVAAAVLLAMSTAWACSPYANQRVVDPLRPDDGAVLEGPPGTTVVIRGFGYETHYGTQIRVEWSRGSDFGQVLDRQVLAFDRIYETKDSEGKPEVHNFYKFTSEAITVPNVEGGFLFVVQARDDGGIGLKTQVFNVTSAPTPPTALPATQPVPVISPPAPQPTVLPAAPSNQVGTVLQPPVAHGSTVAVAPGAERGGAQGAAVVTIVGGQGRDVVPALPLAPVAEAPDRFERPFWMDPSELDRQTLWSGLEKSDGATASLIEPTQPVDDPSRLGAGLLTLGALLLVAGGLVALPRRRARARSRVRRDGGW